MSRNAISTAIKYLRGVISPSSRNFGFKRGRCHDSETQVTTSNKNNSLWKIDAILLVFGQ